MSASVGGGGRAATVVAIGVLVTDGNCWDGAELGRLAIGCSDNELSDSSSNGFFLWLVGAVPPYSGVASHWRLGGLGAEGEARRFDVSFMT